MSDQCERPVPSDSGYGAPPTPQQVRAHHEAHAKDDADGEEEIAKKMAAILVRLAGSLIAAREEVRVVRVFERSDAREETSRG